MINVTNYYEDGHGTYMSNEKVEIGSKFDNVPILSYLSENSLGNINRIRITSISFDEETSIYYGTFEVIS